LDALPNFIKFTLNGTARVIDISSWIYSFFLFLLRPTRARPTIATRS
jgi:hypothetical protein